MVLVIAAGDFFSSSSLELLMSVLALRSIRRHALLVFFVVIVGGVILRPGRSHPLPDQGTSKTPAVAQVEITPARG